MIAEAEALPAGAVFHRCALQVNPYSYREFRGQKIEKDERSRAKAARDHAEAIVERAAELEISVLAITNHNDVSGIADFKRAGKKSGVTIFPGFELVSKDGVHVLCIYSEETSEEQLKLHLGEFGIRTPGPSREVSEHYLAEILAGVHSQGGVTIAAHVTNSKGVLKAFSGTTRINAWKNEYLQAVQIPGSAQDLPDDLRDIVTGKDPAYRRSPEVALLNAGDVVSAADLEKSSATCCIKMSEPSVEGLRQAFLDPASRVRQSDLPPPPRSELRAISWEGGFLDGVAFRFNPNLNILIGGRGAGKSTIIESLRYVLDLEPLGEEARNMHDGIVRQVLKSGTKITLQVCSRHPIKQVYVIERTVHNPPIVRVSSGETSNLSPREILPDLEIYGQHEIAELTRSRKKLTRLLDRFVAPDMELEREKKALRRKLQQTRESLLSAQDKLQQDDERLATLPAIEETLARFPKAEQSQLRLPNLLGREESLLNSAPERWKAFADLLPQIRRGLPVDRAFVSERALQDLPNREILAQVDGILKKIDRDMKEVAKQLETTINLTEKNFSSLRAKWQERREDAESDRQKILREFQKSPIDAEEFLRLQREVENLRPMREEQAKRRKAEAEDQQERRATLVEWEAIKAQQFRALNQVARKISKKLDSLVKVQVTAAGDRTPLGDLLRDGIGGRTSKAFEFLENNDKIQKLSLPEFVAACRNGAGALQEKYAISRSQAVRLASSSEETLLLAEELDLPPTTEIQLNVAPAGATPVWRALEELSTGQKATAALLLLLLESDTPLIDAPLIVDQPEDDLDNRFIMRAVVPRIRAGKWKRQFAFSTHNANIPVLGDAEMVLGLSDTEAADESRTRIAPKHMGAIDVASVRELVEDVLEGGREAFETRRRKYGF